MKKRLQLMGVGVLMVATVFGVSAHADDIQTLARGNRMFAWNLYQQLRMKEGNIFCSPYSVSTALAATYAGARGSTDTQMADVLHFTLKQETLHAAFKALAAHFEKMGQQGAVTLNIANSLWIEKTFTLLQPFLELTQTYYAAKPFQVDFAKATDESRQKINAWVNEKTLKKIPELLQQGDIDLNTTLVLTNAIYFKGNWLNQFQTENTTDAPFWISLEKNISVPTMHQTGQFEYAENDMLQIAALPYVGEHLYIIVLLPNAQDGLADLEVQLTEENVQKWLDMLHPEKIAVSLPKFTMRSRFDLLRTLNMMGMQDLSNFSGISPEGISMTKVIHEAFVDVNEKGTEAAAATAVVMGRSLPRYIEFTADHPFIFFIFDTSSGSVLFLGRVMNPT